MKSKGVFFGAIFSILCIHAVTTVEALNFRALAGRFAGTFVRGARRCLVNRTTRTLWNVAQASAATVVLANIFMPRALKEWFAQQRFMGEFMFVREVQPQPIPAPPPVVEPVSRPQELAVSENAALASCSRRSSGSFGSSAQSDSDSNVTNDEHRDVHSGHTFTHDTAVDALRRRVDALADNYDRLMGLLLEHHDERDEGSASCEGAVHQRRSACGRNVAELNSLVDRLSTLEARMQARFADVDERLARVTPRRRDVSDH